MIVEIDGGSHNDKEEYDEQRDLFLESLGLKIFRITSAMIFNDLENVMLSLEKFVIENYGLELWFVFYWD